MKIYLNRIGYSDKAQNFELPVSIKNPINILISIHILFFILYCILDYTGLLQYLLDDPFESGQFIPSTFALSFYNSGWQYGLLSVFTYQFVHSSVGELLLSTMVLWIFGHILSKQIGANKVVMLYVICVLLSAIVFFLSHVVFTVFSGKSIIEGAFFGVLGVMTTTLVMYKSYQVRVGSNLFIPLWQVVAAVILLSLLFVYKNNMAYILVYGCSIYTGYHFAMNTIPVTFLRDNHLRFDTLKERLN